MDESRKIINRMCTTVGTSTLAGLSRFLEVGPSHVNRAIRENKVPQKWILLVAQKKQVRVEWLENGEGPQRLDEQAAEVLARYGQVTLDDFGPLMDVWQDLEEDERGCIKTCFRLVELGESETVGGVLSLLLRKHEHGKAKALKPTENKKKRP